MLNKSVLLKILQISVSIVILAVLFSYIDIHKIKEVIINAQYRYLFLAFLVLIYQMIVTAYRWLRLLRLAGFSPPTWQCVGAFAASSFMNTTLPGGVGGDIMRAWFITRYGVPVGTATYVTLADRIINVTGYCLLICIAFFFHLWTGERLHGLNFLATSVSAILVGGFIGLVLFAPAMRYLRLSLPVIFTPILGVSRMLGLIFKNRQQCFNLLGINVLIHCLQILAIMLLADALHITLTLQALFIAMPIVLLLSAVPITPGGWGVRESAMVLALAQFQVPTEIALGIAILFGCGITLASIPIVLWWFIQHKRTKNKNEPRIERDVDHVPVG